MKKILTLLVAAFGLQCNNPAAAQNGVAVNLWPDAQHPTDNPKALTHLGSHNALLTDTASYETECEYSNEMRVDSHTPPTIIFHSNDDRTVSPMNSIDFYSAMLKAERQCSLHCYPTGRHGWGFRTTFGFHDQMTDELSRWLNTALNITDTKPAAKH